MVQLTTDTTNQYLTKWRYDSQNDGRPVFDLAIRLLKRANHHISHFHKGEE